MSEHETMDRLKSIRIMNFKSLTALQLELTPLTGIIGNNGAGKSSILQAIDFLFSSVRGEFKNWLDNRGLTAQDIQSSFNRRESPSFSCDFSLKDDKGIPHLYSWDLATHIYKEKKDIIVETESLQCDGHMLFYYANSQTALRRMPAIVKTNIEQENIVSRLELHSSYMRLIGSSFDYWELLKPLKTFITNSNSYELLSPAEMRLSSRGAGNQIGLSGRNLPSFIGKMSEAQKQSFMKKLQSLRGSKISDVSARTSAKAGWTRLETTERYGGNEVNVLSNGISDGTLRLIAFIAISEIKSPDCLMLLDEIENGIDVSYAEAIIKMFEQMTEEGHQLIFTTHSATFLDYISPEDIIYVYRDAEGNTCGDRMFSGKAMSKLAENMYPGEIVANLKPEEIVRRMQEG